MRKSDDCVLRQKHRTRMVPAVWKHGNDGGENPPFDWLCVPPKSHTWVTHCEGIWERIPF